VNDERVRVTIVGVVVVALFSALLGRLWFLQIGNSEATVDVIAQNTYRSTQQESPRGLILDASGRVLVDDRVEWGIEVDRRLAGAQRTLVVKRLGALLHLTSKQVNARIKDPRQSPFEPAVIATGSEVPPSVRLAILEQQERYPHVTVQMIPYRSYPQGTLAAHVLGYVGKVTSPAEAKKHPGYEDNDTIGRAGVEATYDQYLHGVSQRERVPVDPAGRVVGNPVVTTAGKPGDNVYLTLDANLQKVAESSLAEGIAIARTDKNTELRKIRPNETYKAPGGSVVVLDASTGAVAAMASYPTYSPAQFVNGITQAQYKSLTAPPARLLNRATQGLYATGSTFKLVSSVAMIRYNYRGEFTPLRDSGQVDLAGTTFHNANNESHGTVDLRKALTVSSDVYFYTFGDQQWSTWKAGDVNRGYAIQNIAREFGFGEKTGIPLDESAGRVPDAKWKANFARQLYPKGSQALAENSAWNPGDDIELAVGQGDLLATPLQLADAYAAFDNGGTLYTPQLVSRIVDPKTNKVVQQLAPKVRRHIAMDPQLHSALVDGFTGAVNDPDGTAYDAFRDFPLAQHPVMGKTGTAEVVMNKAGDLSDTSVFVGMVTGANGHPYVVVSLVEQAGFGAAISAPIVKRVMQSLIGVANPPPLASSATGND
jgi:penicillin-binding protein 2